MKHPSLRDEIKEVYFTPERRKLLEKHPLTYKRFEEGIDKRTDEIIKLIEKRIEEIYQSDELLSYIGNEEVSYGVQLFHDKLKKEILL